MPWPRYTDGMAATLPNYISPQGHGNLLTEYRHLHRIERPRVVQEVADAAAQGDRSENAEFIYGKRRLREIDRRLRFLGQRIDAAVIIDARGQSGDRVRFGAIVTCEDGSGQRFTWQLVGEDEIDTATNRISFRAPIGAALIGKETDDEIKVRTPMGVRALTIIAVTFPPLEP